MTDKDIKSTEEFLSFLNNTNIRSILIGNGYSLSHPDFGNAFIWNNSQISQKIIKEYLITETNCPEQDLRRIRRNIVKDIIKHYLQKFCNDEDETSFLKNAHIKYNKNRWKPSKFFKFITENNISIYTLNYDPLLYFELLKNSKRFDGFICKNDYGQHDELRNIIQLVHSDSRLISYNVEENLSLSGNHSIEKIKITLRNLLLDSRIRPQNLKTDSIMSFSQGEKQRLIIARAWLKECNIRLYDEATSFLDPKNETKILEQILPKKNDIILFVTHRIASALQFPRVVVFHKGEVVEDGPPLQLLSNKKYFYKLWDKQCNHPLSKRTHFTNTV